MDRRAFDDWAAAAVGSAMYSGLGLYSRHLDELLPPVPAPRSLRDAVAMHSSAVSAVLSIVSEGLVGLAMPWGSCAEIDLVTPDLATWHADDIEPPSLYFMTRDVVSFWDDREELRRPYIRTCVDDWPNHIHVEYRCGRGMAERTRGWEFSKTVWFFTDMTSLDEQVIESG